MYNFFTQLYLANVFNLVGEFDGAGGGKRFPRAELVLIEIFDMAWLKSGGIWGEYTVDGKAAADAGAESEIESFPWEIGGFGKGGEVGVIFGEDRTGVMRF